LPSNHNKYQMGYASDVAKVVWCGSARLNIKGHVGCAMRAEWRRQPPLPFPVVVPAVADAGVQANGLRVTAPVRQRVAQYLAIDVRRDPVHQLRQAQVSTLHIGVAATPCRQRSKHSNPAQWRRVFGCIAVAADATPGPSLRVANQHGFAGEQAHITLERLAQAWVIALLIFHQWVKSLRPVGQKTTRHFPHKPGGARAIERRAVVGGMIRQVCVGIIGPAVAEPGHQTDIGPGVRVTMTRRIGSPAR
jgi:hypothetical protein